MYMDEINSNFKYNNYNNDKNIFRKNIDPNIKLYYHTCFFKLNSNCVDEFHTNLTKLYEGGGNNNDRFTSIMNMKHNVDYGNSIPQCINEINFIENLGVTKRYYCKHCCDTDF